MRTIALRAAEGCANCPIFMQDSALRSPRSAGGRGLPRSTLREKTETQRVLTVSNLLGALQESPDHEQTIVDLREALASGDRARTGDAPMRLIALAREQHEARHEPMAAAGLLAIEIDHTRDDVDRRASLLVRLGRLHREELLDDESAKAAFKAALELRPGDGDIEEAIEAIEAAEANWKDIAKRFVGEADTTSEPSLKTSLLVSAATLVWKYKKKGRDKDVERLFKQALESDPGDARAARLFALTLRRREKWDELAAALLEAGERTKTREDRVFFYRQAARVCARQLEQKDRAAACFERVLDFAPGDEEAMTFLVEHFTSKEQWDHLVALYDDALRSRQKLDNELGIVLQVAMVHWRFRNAPADAEPYFARLRKVDPTHPGMIAFYREYLPAAGDHQKLIAVLTDAQRVASDPRQKLELAVELAKAASASGATDRAIDAWKAVQRIDPRHAEALPALHALYRAGGKWNALVEVLKNEIEALPEGQTDRKVELLRETIPIYREELKLDVMVINTWNAILAIRPDDQEALDALAATYEGLGRWNDLIQVLTKKADATQDAHAQAALYMRVAKLWIDRFANHNQATRPLELVVEKDPTHREALMLLKDIYTKKRSWKQLYDVLRAEMELASDPEVRQAHRIELARIAGERLHRAGDAIAMWKEVLAHGGANGEEALDALEKLADREKDWATVAEVVERRIADAKTDDKERIKLLTKLGTLYGEQMGDAGKAAGAWKRVLALDPKNGRALRTLRESYVSASDWVGLEQLYGEANDWDGLAEVLGNAAEKATDPALKVDLSFRAAAVYENNLKQPHRAFRNYERALATDPKNDRAARALLPIYEREEKWSRIPALSEVILANLAGGGEGTRAERLAILERLRKLALERLNDPQAALRWAIQAFEIDPEDAGTRATLFATAEKLPAGKSDAWGQVTQALTARLGAGVGTAETRWLRAQLASIAADRSGQTDAAVTQFRAMLEADPKDADAAAGLDRLLRGAGRHEELRALYAHRIEHADGDADRWMLLSEQARLEETELGDKAAAAALYRRALELDATDREALAALDRLATEAGRHAELRTVLERRRELAASEGERIDLTLRLGELLAGPLGEPALAKDELARVLESRKTEPRAIQALESIAVAQPALADGVGRVLEPAYEAIGAWDKLRVVLEARMAASKDPEEKRALRLRFAELSTERANDPASAYRVLEGAFLDDPKDSSLWDRLTEAAERAGQQADAATAMATAIDAGELSREDQAALARRVAQIHGDVLGKPDDAEPFHRRVLAFEPGDEGSFNALKELYTERERWNELQTLYRTRIGQTVDADAKLDLLLQLCFLFEELIDDPQAAISAYRDVLELDPRHVAARRALDRLYVRTERWADLAELLRGDLDQQEGDEQTATMVRLGELLEQRLAQPKEAVDQYEAAIQKSPDHEGARQALERLLSHAGQRQRIAAILEPVHEMRGSHADLARILEVQLEAQEDKGAQVALLTRIGEIHQGSLGDAEGTFRAYARAVRLDPSDARLRSELAGAAAQRGAHAERAEVLEQALATVQGDASLQRELGQEIAHIWDDMLGDAPRAEVAYGRLIEAADGDAETLLEAARALERIHVASGEHGKLAVDLRRQIDLESDPDRKRQLLVRLGDLVEEQLGDRGRAIAIQEERLQNDPSDSDALRALERLYEAAENWAALAGVLEKLDPFASTDDERKVLARRIGALRETKLSDPSGAIQAYNDVVQRFGADRESLMALIRLYEAAERWTELLEVVLMVRDISTSPQVRAALTFHAAELMRTRTNETERSIEAYQEVLEADAHHEGALGALHDIALDPEAAERFAAARALRPRYESSANYPALIEVLEVLAASDDPAERLSSLRRATEIAEGPLGEAGKAFDFAMRAARLAASEPEIGSLVADGERLAASADRWLDYATILMEVAPEIGDAEVQVDAYRKIATIAESRLADVDTARQYYEKILAERADDRPAFEALERIAQSGEKWPALLEVLVRKTDIATSPDERVQLLLRRAELSETKLGDVATAIDTYDAVLSESESVPAYQGLERLYTKAERFSDLASLYERMLERSVGFPVETRYKLGRLYREHLNDPFMALEQFREALSGGAPHEPTIEQLEQLMAGGEQRAAAAAVLEPIYQQRLQWAKVEGALEARLSGEGDPETRKQLLERLGRLREEYLEDLDGALGLYARLFREDPRDESTWDTLARLAKALDAWPRVAEIYRATLDEIGVEDPETAKLATIAAQMFEQHGGGGAEALAKAAALYGKALAFAPTDRGVFLALEALHQRTEKWDALLALYRSQVDVAENDAERVSLLEKSALVLRDRLGDADKAIDTYREILDVDPQHAGASEALDALFAQRERWNDLAEHLRHRIQYASGAQEIQLRQRLGTLLAEKLEDRTLAIDTFEEIARQNPEHAESVAALEKLVTDPQHQARIIEILEPIYQATDQWRKRIAILEAKVDLAEDPSEKAAILSEIGHLHEDRGRALNMSFDAHARAMALEPGNEAHRAQVDRLAGVLGTYDLLVEAYEAAIKASTDPVVTSSLLNTIARVHDEKRGDPRAAIVTYERLIAHDAEDASPLDALEALHTMVGDWRGMVSVLERKVDRAYDPVERGELLRRAGSVAEDLLGDRAQAIALYKRASEEDANDPVALESLDRLYSEAADHERLGEVLKRRLEIEGDLEARVDVALRLGALSRDALRDPEGAIEAYVRVLSDREGEPTAVAALTELYERQARWPDLLENLRLRAGLATDVAERVAFLHRSAEVLERELDDVPEALVVHEQVLGIDPRYEPSIRALVRIAKLDEHRASAAAIVLPILEREGRYAELSQLLALVAEASRDPMERKDTLRRLAYVEEQGLGNLAAAFDAESRALAEDPADTAIADSLESLAQRLGAYDKLADALAARASSASDPDAARNLYARLARVAEGALGDDARAIEAHKRTLENASDDLDALAALDRLYVKQSDWQALAEILDRRIQLEGEPTARRDLLVRLGSLRWEQFEDVRGAFSSFAEVLEREPDEPRALGAIEGLLADESMAQEVVETLDQAYRATGSTAKVAALYDVRVRIADSDGERVRLLGELAQLQENELHDNGAALTAAMKAFELDPRDETLLSEVERLAGASGSFTPLVGLAERVGERDVLDRTMKRDLALRAASWYRDRLGDLGAAEGRLRAALEADRESGDAHAQLVDLLRASGRQSTLVAALRAWAEVEFDEEARKERLREAARLAESMLGDIALAADSLERILQTDGADTQALDELVRIRMAEGKWPAVASLLEKRIDAEAEPTRRVELRRQLAHAFQGPLADDDRAIEAWRGVLDEEATDLDAIGALETLYEKGQRWRDLEELVQRRLDIAETQADRIAARVRLARLVERLGRRADAIDQLHEILGEDPTNGEALDELERLLAADKRWDDLSDLVRRRIDDAVGRGDVAGEVTALSRLADLQEKQLGRAEEALETWERVVERDPSRAEAFATLVRLYTAAGRHADAAEASSKRIALLPREEAIVASYALADLAETKLADPARQEQALRHAFELDRSDAETRRRLKAFYEKQGRHRELADLLALDLETTADKAPRIALLKRIADLYSQKLGDPGSAARYFEQAAQLDPENRDVLLPLCDLYIAAGRSADAVPVLEKIIASYGTKRSKEVAVYQHRMGQALEGLGQTAQALAAYDAAFKIDLTSVAILRDLGRLCYQSGDFDRAQKTFRALLLQKLDGNSGITKGDVYFYLGDISAKQGDPKKGIQMLERAVQEEAGHPRATALLAQLKG
ncbi:MAG: tetratricopeptide repeat protein [Sandaracinus sp.]